MNLGQLVLLRNNLKKISTTEAKISIDALDGSISQNLRIPLDLYYQNSVNHLIDQIDTIEKTLEKIENSVPGLICNIEQELESRTKDYLARGYLINGYYGSNSTDVYTERTDRILPINDATRSEIIALSLFGNWTR